MSSEELLRRARGPSIATRGNLYARAWMLLLVDAAARSGLTPISKLRLHRLAYLSNCLSRVYEIRSNDESIVKYKRGPYYPILQWHVDRLAGQQLLVMSKVRHFIDNRGPWMDASYSFAKRGVEVATMICATAEMKALSEYLLEIAKAFAYRHEESLDDLPLADLTYSDQRRAGGSVIDFSDPAANFSFLGAQSFGSFVRDPRLITEEDQIYLYMQYLDETAVIPPAP